MVAWISAYGLIALPILVPLCAVSMARLVLDNWQSNQKRVNHLPQNKKRAAKSDSAALVTILKPSLYFASLALSSFSICSSESFKEAAVTRSLTWASLVALAMGAVM